MGMLGSTWDEQGWRKGPWTPEEDKLLTDYIYLHGDGRWTSVSRFSGVNRSGKSCRLRWVNYLRPGLKKGKLTPQEEGIIIELHALWGNKWSTIARYLPGRTDNEIKNYWRTHFKPKAKPSQRQAKRKAELALRPNNHHQEEIKDDTNNLTSFITSVNEFVKNENIIAMGSPPQATQEMVMAYPAISNNQHQNSPMIDDINHIQPVASCSDTITLDDLWGGLWNLQDDPHDHRSVCQGNEHALLSQPYFCL